jgi:chromosome segregation protein
MDRRAIIEEAAGITMYKTKKRLAEAKLEASRLNLARVNDILVEVEKQLASLKRQASKARRYAEIREEMRGLLRTVLASKAQQLDAEAERLEKILSEMAAEELRETQLLHELEADQERLSARTYELDGELRQTQNLLGESALELDRAENRILFNRERIAQLEARSTHVAAEIVEIESQTERLETRARQHFGSVAGLRQQTAELESILKASLESVVAGSAEQDALEARIEELRQSAVHLGEEAVRAQAESVQAEEGRSDLGGAGRAS